MSKTKKIQIYERDLDCLDGWNVHHLSAKYQAYPDACFSYEYNYDGSTISVVYPREETDEEYATRMKKEREAAKRKKLQINKTKEKDLIEFNRIREKYDL